MFDRLYSTFFVLDFLTALVCYTAESSGLEDRRVFMILISKHLKDTYFSVDLVQLVCVNIPGFLDFVCSTC